MKKPDLKKISVPELKALALKHKKNLAIGGAMLLAGVVFFFYNSAPAPKVTAAPQYYIHDEESFEAVEKSFHKNPYNDPQLEFTIMLPKDWTSLDPIQADTAGNLNRRILSDLARYVSPYINTMQAEVTVQSIKLTREISAEHWLKHFMLINNYTLDGAVTAIDDHVATASAISLEGGKSSYVYMRVNINAANAVITRFATPLELKDYLAFLRKRTVDSFRFILATDHPIENQKIFNLGEAVKFAYPASWQVSRVDVENADKVSMQLFSEAPDEGINTGGKKKIGINGLMRFVAVKRAPGIDLKKAARDLRDSLSADLGFDFKRLVSSSKVPDVSDRFIFSRYEIYEVMSRKGNNNSSQELRLVALGDKEWYVFGVLLSPSSADNFFTWAANTRAFDIVTRKIQ